MQRNKTIQTGDNKNLEPILFVSPDTTSTFPSNFKTVRRPRVPPRQLEIALAKGCISPPPGTDPGPGMQGGLRCFGDESRRVETGFEQQETASPENLRFFVRQALTKFVILFGKCCFLFYTNERCYAYGIQMAGRLLKQKILRRAYKALNFLLLLFIV